MILESLEAENFQKYERLAILNLPERGVIGIVGENESGKSTIGEILAFALFGRTLKLDESQRAEIVNWGKDTCRVRVGFRLPDGKSYRITREIDREGSYSAELDETASGKQLAHGVGRVNRRLAELLPVSFDEFRYSFYLGQKELDLVHDSSAASRRQLLDKMIGVNNIEEASAKVTDGRHELKGQLERLHEEVTVHREVMKQLGANPLERDGLLAETNSLRGERSAQESELSRLGGELDEVARDSRALGVARALGLRSVLRGYGVAFARLAAWLRQATGQLQTRLQALERDSAASAVALENTRMLEAKKDELASVLRVRQRELDDQLRNSLEADYTPEDAAYITPNTKAEQLAFNQKKLQETVAELDCQQRRARRRWGIGSLLWVAGLALLLALEDFNFLFFIVFGLLYTLWGLLTRSRAADTEERRARLAMNADRLSDDVGRCETARQACSRFELANLGSMSELIGLTGSEWARELHRQIVSRFGELLNKPDGFADELVGKLNSLREEAATVRRELAELDLLTADLEEELERLSRSGHARVVRPPSNAADGYKSGEVREARSRIRSMIELCRKAQFELEKAPVDALDRDFAEFEPAVSKQPAIAAAGLDVPALTELDSGATAMDIPTLERTLLAEGGKLASLAAASEELASRAEGLSRRQQELKVSAARTGLKLEELSRELARVEPKLKRSAELDQILAQLGERQAELEHKVAVHESLLEMFAQLRDHMRSRFGPQLADYIGWVLPKLTDGRYDQVRVEPDLTVTVYSAEKQGFVPLASLSGGTVDQLFLTLRLAFSKALLHTKLSPDVKQYLFFDEPLSSFDEKRGVSFLDLLKKFHKNFEQVFVVTHTPGLESHFDRLIRTNLETRELLSP
jgi:DNA repair exonuclease SbcCD ATPase subunit